MDFTTQQLQLQSQINITNQFEQIKYIAGVDVSYFYDENFNIELAICAIVVVDYETKKEVETVVYSDIITVPYIPGYLSFRELPIFLQTNELLTSSVDAYMFDGNGYLHPRNMGIATHAGIVLKKPTIGVAKNYHKIFDINFVPPDNVKGAYSNIVINNKVYGCALRTHSNVKPIFVSAGNFIDLETSCSIVMELVTNESRIPLPTRLAHIEANRIARIAREVSQ
ncbi:MAG: endonuclease V [Epulopiscium sp. Nele67-Bin001]|nr:MAG: endonuclease V [Epulopiscium sp. Nuni2H_MBin001]OON91817.1 MAG: endonuclease V [Epulopiscium sp. Nele67-Bin001]